MNTFIPALTSLICSHKHRTANYCKESFFSSIIIRFELDSDGVGDGEGAGDGFAAVALGGHTVIDLNPVSRARILIISPNIEIVKSEGDCISIT